MPLFTSLRRNQISISQLSFATLLLVCGLSFQPAFSQRTFRTTFNYGDGKDGNLMVTTPTTLALGNAKVDDVLIGTTSTTIVCSNLIGSFSAGQQVLIVDFGKQPCNSQNYEIADIVSVSGNTLTFNYPFTLVLSGLKTMCQVVRIPEYTTANISAKVSPPTYNASLGHGGILIFKVNGTLTMNPGGSLDASEAGGPKNSGGQGGPSNPLPSCVNPGSKGIVALPTIFGVHPEDATDADLGDCTPSGSTRSIPSWIVVMGAGPNCPALATQQWEGGRGGKGGSAPVPLKGSTPNYSPYIGLCKCDLASKRIAFGKAGKGGQGGAGATAGGAGGGGGGNTNRRTSTPSGGDGTDGTRSVDPVQRDITDGNGGEGGIPGGFIYVRANTYIVNTSNPTFKSNGGNGGDGEDGVVEGQEGGDGGDGAPLYCDPLNQVPNGTPGEGGAAGRGASGGNGGWGGEHGDLWLFYQSTHNVSGLNIELQEGEGGFGGIGAPDGTKGQDGSRGNTDLNQCNICPNAYYLPYERTSQQDCDCKRAFEILAATNQQQIVNGNFEYTDSGDKTLPWAMWSTADEELIAQERTLSSSANLKLSPDIATTYIYRCPMQSEPDFWSDMHSTTASTPTVSATGINWEIGQQPQGFYDFEEGRIYLDANKYTVDLIAETYCGGVDGQGTKRGSSGGKGGKGGTMSIPPAVLIYDPYNYPQGSGNVFGADISDFVPSAMPLVSLFPSPATNIITLRAVSEIADVYRGEIVSIIGEKLRSFALPVQAGENYWQIEVQDLPVGTYVIKVTSPTATHSLPFIKQ